MGSVESRLKDVIDEITMMGGPEKRMLHIFLTTICRDFVLAWSARGGVGFLPHLLKLIRLKRFDIVEAVGVSFGWGAARFGLFIALYFALFKILEKMLRHYRKRQDSWNAFIAGALASVSLLVEEHSFRWTFSQYLSVRALFCAWNHFQQRYPQARTLSHYGDALLFALCSGQAVYSFILRPDTVDPAYRHFLTQVTHIDPLVIAMFRQRLRTGLVSKETLARFVQKCAAKGLTLPSLHKTASRGDLTCGMIHPGMDCLTRIFWMLPANFKLVFPMYFSLHIVPPILFKFKHSLKRPHQTLWAAVKNGAQSSSFMTMFVFIFQILLCTQRNLMETGLVRGEWRYSYWLMGFMASASVFLEKKQRRAELALYMLPRAGISLYRALVQKHWAVDVPGGDLLMFAASMALIMKSYRQDKKALSAIMTRILGLFI